MRIGILGGSFDPVHFGHIQLAKSLMEIHHLDQVLWIPVKINPLKIKAPVADFHRLAMLKMAIEGFPAFKIQTIEMERPDASYTIDTLRFLKEKFPDDQLYLLLGDDVLSHFMQWKEPLEIVTLAPPLVGARTSLENPYFANLTEEIRPYFQKGWTKTLILEISSTQIRDRLKKGLDCSHLVPAKVLDYIALHGLYSSL